MKKVVALFIIALISNTAKAQTMEIKSNAFEMILGAYNITNVESEECRHAFRFTFQYCGFGVGATVLPTDSYHFVREPDLQLQKAFLE